MDTLVVLMLMWLKRPKALMSNLKEKGLILAPRSRIKYIIMEKSEWWELNGPGHIVLLWANRKGWMHINCLTLVSNYTAQNPSQGMTSPIAVGSAHSSCITKITPSRHASRPSVLISLSWQLRPAISENLNYGQKQINCTTQFCINLLGTVHVPPYRPRIWAKAWRLK